MKQIKSILIITLMVIFLLEVALRLYNPFHFRIKGEHIVLNSNKTFEIINDRIPVLDSVVINKKNSLGFRGPQPPKNFGEYLTIVTIGGSTTECQYLNEGKTWSDQLFKRLQGDFDKIWLNNAGIAGHSTHGHLALLQDHVSTLKPKAALFLVGINDIGRDDLNDSDKANMTNSYRNFFTFLSKNSELCNVLLNLLRARQAKIRNLTDTYLDLKNGVIDSVFLPDSVIQKMVARHKKYQEGYGQRLRKLINTCNDNNIEPVFITQPLLLGEGIDSISGVNFETLKINSVHNGKSFWQVMEGYNNMTRQIAKEYGIPLIDAAKLMPKNSYYFYDMLHFTNTGAQKLGDVIYQQFKPYLSLRHGNYLKQ